MQLKTCPRQSPRSLILLSIISEAEGLSIGADLVFVLCGFMGETVVDVSELLITCSDFHIVARHQPMA